MKCGKRNLLVGVILLPPKEEQNQEKEAILLDASREAVSKAEILMENKETDSLLPSRST